MAIHHLSDYRGPHYTDEKDASQTAYRWGSTIRLLGRHSPVPLTYLQGEARARARINVYEDDVDYVDRAQLNM